MDRLDKCYIWHILTKAKLRLKLKESKKAIKKELDASGKCI